MANWSLQLVSAVVRAKDPSSEWDKVTRMGIKSMHMPAGGEARTVWDYISAHYNRPTNYGRVPSEAQLLENFQYVDFATPVENTQDLCRLVKESYLRRKAITTVESFADVVQDNPVKALTDVRAALDQLDEQIKDSDDVSFADFALSMIMEEQENYATNAGVTGIPYPWDLLTQETGGIQPGDYIMMYAIPKSMKTWLGLYITAGVWMSGRNVLIFSKEMQVEALFRRLAAIIAKVSYGKIRKGQLSPVELKHYYSVTARMSMSYSPDLNFTTATRLDGSPGGPDEITSKVMKYRPDFVLLDSAYLLELPGKQSNALDWRNMSIVSRQIKAIANSTRIPILAIYQENERAALSATKGRGTASIAGNTSYIQDCDLAMRLVKNASTKEISIHLAAARETELTGFTIHAHAAENFGFSGMHMHQVGDDFDPSKKSQPTTTKATEAAIKTAVAALTSHRDQ